LSAKKQCRVHISSPVGPTPSYLYSVDIWKIYNLNFNIFFPSTSGSHKWLLTFTFWDRSAPYMAAGQHTLRLSQHPFFVHSEVLHVSHSLRAFNALVCYLCFHTILDFLDIIIRPTFISKNISDMDSVSVLG
jgi:hypothetical protein